VAALEGQRLVWRAMALASLQAWIHPEQRYHQKNMRLRAVLCLHAQPATVLKEYSRHWKKANQTQKQKQQKQNPFRRHEHQRLY
jgi:hypothetical protein